MAFSPNSCSEPNMLSAFKNEISAQAGKHISAMAAELLMQDADSLISQIP
jgi:hypothetical protein